MCERGQRMWEELKGSKDQRAGRMREEGNFFEDQLQATEGAGQRVLGFSQVPRGKRSGIFEEGKRLGDNGFKFGRDRVSEEAVITDDAELRGKNMLNEFENKLMGVETTERLRVAALLVEESNKWPS